MSIFDDLKDGAIGCLSLAIAMKIAPHAGATKGITIAGNFKLPIDRLFLRRRLATPPLDPLSRSCQDYTREALR
jgi:hypothetical protein